MRGNSFGKLLSFTSFGESHGPGMGVVLDGVPSNLHFSLDDLRQTLLKRAPGQIPGTSPRVEADAPEILSGIFENRTLGSPIAVWIKNTNQRSADYDEFKNMTRPGHADQTTMDKFGIRDHRGGGRASARETIARVVAGYFAGLILPKLQTISLVTRLGPFELPNPQDYLKATDLGPYYFGDLSKTKEIEEFLLEARSQGESWGGAITTNILQAPKGLGEPAYDKLKADLSKAMTSINACIGIEFGLGQKMLSLPGSQVSADRANFGGMEGGMSNGETITFTTFFKPTSTIGEKAKAGRHDPCVVPRAVPIVNAMAKIVLADHFLRQEAYQRWLPQQ